MGWVPKIVRRTVGGAGKIVKKTTKGAGGLVRGTGRIARRATDIVIDAPANIAGVVAGNRGKRIVGRTLSPITSVTRTATGIATGAVEFSGQFLQTGNLKTSAAIFLANQLRGAHRQYLSFSRPLSPIVARALVGEFGDLVNWARFCIVRGDIQFNLPAAINMGRKLFGENYAVTVGNVMVFNYGPPNLSHWAHEMTHVRQYKELGFDRFAYVYARDLGNALEREARQVAANYPGEPII